MSQHDCLFCPKPEQITNWWYEDSVCRVINTPGGSPMVIVNRHADSPTTGEKQHIDEVVHDLYGAHTLRVVMNHVTNHWHAHIRNYEQEPTEPLYEA